MKKLANRILKRASELINNNDFCAKHKVHSKDFTRQKKLGFVGVITATLGIIVKSLQLALDDYFEQTKMDIDSYTKQAFSKARANIQPSAYKELFTMSVDEIFDNDAIKRHCDYRFFAIDGTDLMLPQSKAIREKFKPVSGSRLPHARASFFYDVVSSFLLDACFDSVETDERTMAFSHLKAVKSRLGEKDVILADRGYPSKELITYCADNNINYLMRLQKSFSAEIDASTETDFVWQMVFKGKTISVRVVKSYRENGTPTILITNLPRETFSAEELLQLYTMRWPIETRFEALKIKLEAEKFSGKTPESLTQDFYARLFLMNVEAAVKSETNEIISLNDKEKPHKYLRKTNENILFGMLRKNLSRLLLERDDEKRTQILDTVIRKASKCTVQIKPNRSFERARRSHKRITESPKRCL